MNHCCFVCGGTSQVHPLQAGDEADHAGEAAASRYRLADSQPQPSNTPGAVIWYSCCIHLNDSWKGNDTKFSVKKTIRGKIFQSNRISLHPEGVPHNLSTPSIYGLPPTTMVISIPVYSAGSVMAWWMQPEHQKVWISVITRLKIKVFILERLWTLK